MKPRSRQLSLRLDAATPDRAANWRAGACIAYLGRQCLLQLDTDRQDAALESNTLHLPLPPAATPRQIQDSAEAWLRREAERLIETSLMRQAACSGRSTPRWALSFSARRGWASLHADGSLRFNWRLVEQPTEVIDQVVGQVLAGLPQERGQDTADFWGMLAA